MEFDLKIERIGNGYIFSDKGVDDGDVDAKRQYKTLKEFGNSLMEELREKDRVINQHETPVKPFVFKLTTDL